MQKMLQGHKMLHYYLPANILKARYDAKYTS